MSIVVDLGVYGANGYTVHDTTQAGNRMSSQVPVPPVQPELSHTTIQRLADTINDYEVILHPGEFIYI